MNLPALLLTIALWQLPDLSLTLR